jgi:hypothetical protein
MATKVNTLTIYFNGGVLKFDPSMLIPDTKSREVFFNPTIKYNPRVVYYIPPGQNRKYRYNKFFSATAFNDQIISETLRSLNGKQLPLTLGEAKRTGVTDFNIYATLHALFSTDSVLYINKKPYTIFSYNWNKEWQIDTKMTDSYSNMNNPYVSDAFMRYSHVQEESAQKELGEIPNEALMSAKMEENIKKNVDAGVAKANSVKSIKSKVTLAKQGSKLIRVNPITKSNIDAYPICLKRLKDKSTNIKITYAFNRDFKIRSTMLDPISLTFSIPKDQIVTIIDVINAKPNNTQLLEQYEKLCERSELLLRSLNRNDDLITETARKVTALLPMYETLFKKIQPIHAEKQSKLDCGYDVEENSIYVWIHKNTDFFKKYKSNSIVTPINELIDELIKSCDVVAVVSTNNVTNNVINDKQIEDYSNALMSASQLIDEIKSIEPEIMNDVEKAHREYASQYGQIKCNTSSTLSLTSNKEKQALEIIKMIDSTLIVQNINENLNGFTQSVDECVRNTELFFNKVCEYYGMISDFLSELKGNCNELDIECKFFTTDILLYNELSKSGASTIDFDEFYVNLAKMKMRIHRLRVNVSTELYALNNDIIKYYNEPNLIKVDSNELCSYIIELKILFETQTNVFLSKLSSYADQIMVENKATFTTSAKIYKRNYDEYMKYAEDDRNAYETSLSSEQPNNAILASAQANVDQGLISAYNLSHDELQIKNAKKNILAQVYLTDICCKLLIAKTQSDYNNSVYDAIHTDIAIELDAHNALFGKSIHYNINVGSLVGSPSLLIDKNTNDNKISDTTKSFKQIEKLCNKRLKEAQQLTDVYLHKTCESLLEDSANDYETQLSILGYAVDDDLSKMLNKDPSSNGWTVYAKNGVNDALSIACDMLNSYLSSIGKTCGHELSTNGVFLSTDVINRLTTVKTIDSNDINFDATILELMTFALKIRFILIDVTTSKDGYSIGTCAGKMAFKLSDIGLDDDDDTVVKYKQITQFAVMLKYIDVKTNQISYAIPHNTSFVNAIIDIDDVTNVGLLSQINDKCTKNLSNEVDVLKNALTEASKKILKKTVQLGGGEPLSVARPEDDDVARPEDDMGKTSAQSSQPNPSIKPKDNRARQDFRINNKLSYYIMVDLVLSPGDKMNPLEKMSMACTRKMDNIHKSLSETFGYVYAPPPLFTDYDVTPHDKDSSKISNATRFETPYDTQMDQKDQREREMHALMTDNYKKDQELTLHKNMLNNAQTNRRPFGLF